MDLLESGETSREFLLRQSRAGSGVGVVVVGNTDGLRHRAQAADPHREAEPRLAGRLAGARRMVKRSGVHDGHQGEQPAPSGHG